VHGVLAQYHRRGIKVEGDPGVTIDERVRVRRGSIHSEIAWLHSGRVTADEKLVAFVELESAIHHRLEQRASAQAPSTNAVREETRPSKLVLRKRRNEVHLDSGVLRLARK
jgi:hypothetical protein